MAAVHQQTFKAYAYCTGLDTTELKQLSKITDSLSLQSAIHVLQELDHLHCPSFASSKIQKKHRIYRLTATDPQYAAHSTFNKTKFMMGMTHRAVIAEPLITKELCVYVHEQCSF